MTVIACLAAAWAKKTTGRGQKVDVSMLDGLLPLMTLQMAHVWSTKTSFAPGEAPLSGGLACYGVYRCRDGKYMALGILEEKFWKKFCQMAGRPDWIDQFLLHGDDAKKLRAEIADLFLTKTRAEWTQQAAQLDICLTPVWDPLEVEEDPHIRARGMIIKQDHPACGEVKGIQPPIKFSETPAEPSCPAPVLGQDTFDILSEIGFSADRIKRLENDWIVLTAKTNQDETT
jgi:crotonobetainyl-CoA:carnitine CoA-transferase CaiB-like acyl-CoA transferase